MMEKHIDYSGCLACKESSGFTLAEVLITLAIIGVVAALSLPTLLQAIAERSSSETQANVAQKITKSMNLMRADGALEKTYASTDDFVDELSKYLKITTRCDADHIASCWPSKTVITKEGKVLDVSKVKTGRNLQIPGNKTGNVGMILADGTALIMTYNPDAPIIGEGDTVIPSTASLPIGFGRYKDYAYTSSVTAGVDFVMDTNGFQGPNSETRDGKYKDIRSFKVAAFSEGCPGEEFDGIGCLYMLPSYGPLDTTLSENKKYDSKFASTNNNWAGARKGCQDIGMDLPSRSQAESIVKKSKSNSKLYSMIKPGGGCIWSSTEWSIGNNWGYTKSPSVTSGDLCNGDKDKNMHKALCIGD